MTYLVRGMLQFHFTSEPFVVTICLSDTRCVLSRRQTVLFCLHQFSGTAANYLVEQWIRQLSFECLSHVCPWLEISGCYYSTGPRLYPHDRLFASVLVCMQEYFQCIIIKGFGSNWFQKVDQHCPVKDSDVSIWFWTITSDLCATL